MFTTIKADELVLPKIPDFETKTNTWYFGVFDFNRAVILNTFMKILAQKFTLKIDKASLTPAYLHCVKYDASGNRTHLAEGASFFTGITGSIGFASFIIDDCVYYIQINNNPFMEDSSYITCNHLFKDLFGNIYTKEIYAGNGNINHCFVNRDIWLRPLRDEEILSEATHLYDYFMNNIFKQQSEYYVPHLQNTSNLPSRTTYYEIEEDK